MYHSTYPLLAAAEEIFLSVSLVFYQHLIHVEDRDAAKPPPPPPPSHVSWPAATAPNKHAAQPEATLLRVMQRGTLVAMSSLAP
jgi:hypothetical protein